MGSGYTVPPMVADAIFNQSKATLPERKEDQLHVETIGSFLVVELIMETPNKLEEGEKTEMFFSYMPKHIGLVCWRAKMDGAQGACSEAFNILHRRWRDRDTSPPEFADSEVIKTLKRVLQRASHFFDVDDPPKVSVPFTSTPVAGPNPLHTMWGTAKEQVNKGDAVSVLPFDKIIPIGGK